MFSFQAAAMPGNKKPTIACGDSGFRNPTQTSTRRLPREQQSQQSQ